MRELKHSLTEYFTSPEIFPMKYSKSNRPGKSKKESMDANYTKMRTLAADCELDNAESEILTQMMRGCSSSRMRRNLYPHPQQKNK